MRTSVVLPALFLILTVAAVSPMAMAQSPDVSITVTARQSDCPGDRTFCWEVASHDPLAPGDVVEVTVINPEGNTQHDLYLTFDAEHQADTDEGTAEQSSEPIAAGEQTTVTFTVPEGASSVYYWCSVQGHESLGMYGTWDVQGPASEEEAGSSSSGEENQSGASSGDGAAPNEGNGPSPGSGEETSGAPGPGLIAGLAAIGMAAVVLARRG